MRHIKNTKLIVRSFSHKICIDCKHFIANETACGKYYTTNLISGKKNYTYAAIIRIDEQKCGQKAKEFEEIKMSIIMTPYYSMKKLFWKFFIL